MKKPLQSSTNSPDSKLPEPIYDANRLLTDHAYRYEMVDVFATYMDSIKPYVERVRFFIKICRLMNLPLDTLAYGGGTIENRSYNDRRGYAGICVDEQGNEVSVLTKYWRRPADGSSEERAVLHRTYFEEYLQPNLIYFEGVDIKSLSELKAYYSSKIADHPNSASFIQSELNTTQRTIDAYQKKIDEWYLADSLRHQPLKEQFAKASQFVEDEVNGSKSIQWELFIRADYLKPIAFLWNIVSYKLFLINQIKSPNLSPSTTSDTLSERERILIHCYKGLPAIRRGEFGYQDYMTFARPGDRTGYPNDSERKAKSLIRSIEKIKSHLTDSERQQAQSEVDTIRAKFS